MKLCIPVVTPDGLNAALASDFGAAQHLLLIDSEHEHFLAIDRAKPEAIQEEHITGIQGILCGEIHPRLLMQLQQNGIQVFGCEAETAAAALAQFRAGELEAAPAFNPHADLGAHAHDGACCGGHTHEHAHADGHECCGGKGHDNPDHECCGGKGHGHDAGGCGGHGHAHGASGGCGRHS